MTPISNGFVDRTSLNVLLWPIFASAYRLKEILETNQEAEFSEDIQVIVKQSKVNLKSQVYCEAVSFLRALLHPCSSHHSVDSSRCSNSCHLFRFLH